MISNCRCKAKLTGYINNIYYNELFKFTRCPVQGYSIFYWMKRQYKHNENMIYEVKRV